MNGTFYDQLGCVAGMFEQWGTCERTVIACALAKRVPWPGLRLVQRAVEAALQSHVEDERLERDANDESHVTSLLAARAEDDDEEDRLCQLLTLIPLLQVDNEHTKSVYVGAVPALVQRCVDAPRRTNAPDLCRQLLSYLLVHPALTVHDQTTLIQWLRFLENHMSDNRSTESVWQQKVAPCLFKHSNIWSSNNAFRRTIGKNLEFKGLLDSMEQSICTEILQESFSKNGRDVDVSLEGGALNFEPSLIPPKSQRSNSLTPPTNTIQMSSSSENLNDEPLVQKPRSFSLSSEHSLGQLRPMILFGTTGSETRLDDLRLNNFTEHPGMSTVGPWLKSLRLHKYVWLFTNITYNQMLAMDEQYLEKLGVTKGARHKILLSIKKLSERRSILDGIQAEMTTGGGSVLHALERLRGVLLSPMPPSSELPAAVVHTLDLASECLGGNDAEGPELDPMSLHCWLVEKALHHELYGSPELQTTLHRLRHRLPPRQFFHHVSDLPQQRRNKPRWRAPQYMSRNVRRHWLPRGKSNSYPPFPPLAPGELPCGLTLACDASPTEDYSGLDALCLQMTEQAIN